MPGHREHGMITVAISIDVPTLADGMRFYSDVFGFRKVAEPLPGMLVLDAGNASICLLEKDAGTAASTATDDTRRYERHWTPVHLDLHVDDFRAVLARALAAGATQEQLFENAKHGAVAFCSDPFGHGFCLIEKRK
jgi:predicted enzyme related to lactoylglutathione lyase